MTNESVRVQMSSHTRQHLEAIAIDYGCLYGGKPSISGLIAQIADGRLKINSEIPYPCGELPVPLLKMHLWLPSGLKGMFACIARTIADFGGNIYQAETVSEVDRRGVASILFSLPENGDLAKLITALKNLRIQDVANFNQEREILTAISNPREVTLDDDTLDLRTHVVERLYGKKLVCKISCSIGLKILAKNKVGLLWKVAQAIAEQGFNISQVRQDFNAKDHLDLIEIFISLEPHPSMPISQDMDKIQTITNTIAKIPGIQAVRHLGMDKMWKI